MWFCGKQHLDKSRLSISIPKKHGLCVQRFHSIRKGAEDQFFNFYPGIKCSMRVSNLTIDSFRVKFTANGKFQIQVENTSKLKKKIAGKNSSKQFLVDKTGPKQFTFFLRRNEH